MLADDLPMLPLPAVADDSAPRGCCSPCRPTISPHADDAVSALLIPMPVDLPDDLPDDDDLHHSHAVDAAACSDDAADDLP